MKERNIWTLEGTFSMEKAQKRHGINPYTDG